MRSAAVVLCTVLAACGDEQPATPSTARSGSLLDAGWPAEIVRHPDEFANLMARTNRSGWVAMHGCDWATAARMLGGLPRVRAELDQARFERDLARLADLAWQKTYAEWETRSGLPSGSAIPVVAALAAFDAGDAESAHAWLDKGTRYADPAVAALAQALAKDGLAVATRAASASGPAACIALHARLRAEPGDDARARFARATGCGLQPIVRERDGDHTRTFYDPLVYRTLAAAHEHAAQVAAKGDPKAVLASVPADQRLPATLFSGWWTAADAAADLGQGEPGPTLQALADAGSAPRGDDAQWARQRVRALDRALDAWRATAYAAADDKGREILDNLRPVALWRSRALLALARQALAKDRPHEALAYALLGMDVEHAGSIGPLNPPALFAVLAEAHLRTGHTREALDALQPLVARYPEVRGLVETIGDLAVLQGLGRNGDSKEN